MTQAQAPDPQKQDPQDPEVTDKKAVTADTKGAPVVAAGPVAVHVEAGDVKVVVAPPARDGFDRRLYRVLNDLPHSKHSDRYVSVLSDLGEGLGWVAGGIAIAILGGPKGRRAGAATAIASLAATYVVQQRVKPIFRRVRPFVNLRSRPRPRWLFFIREPPRWPTRWRRRSACPGSTSACTFPATPRWAE
jgi:hypothetical protein